MFTTSTSVTSAPKTVDDYNSMLEAIARWRDEAPDTVPAGLLELLPDEFEKLKAEVKAAQGAELPPTGASVYGVRVVLVTREELQAELELLLARLRLYLSPFRVYELPDAAVLRRVYELRQRLGA